MENVELIIGKLCGKYRLGRVIKPPLAVTGGLLHKMYHVVTDKGEYAVKILNPNIMKRDNVLNNMIYSEQISNELKNKINLIGAKEFDSKRVIMLDEYYFMVFEWLEGKSVFGDDITENHCEQIGLALGKIHKANIHIEGLKPEGQARKLIDWDYLLNEAEKQKVDYAGIIRDNLSKLKKWDRQSAGSFKEVSKRQVISHRDLDPKNVMWKDNKPFIIDWEAAGYVNPFQELIEVINYWCVNPLGKYDNNKLSKLMKGYVQSMNIAGVNWEAILNCSYDGMSGWLEYNLKRALGIEGAGENDKEEGKTQLIQTIFELNKCSERQEELRELLYSCEQNCPEELILNIEKLHTTALGITRIKKNLSLAADDVVNWCKSKILSNNADITRKGKNWYINVDNCIITVNRYSYTIITAHREKKQAASGQKGE